MPKLLPRRWLIGLAIVAVLMNALAPSLSQALQASRARVGGWTQICSALGMRWVQLKDFDAKPSEAPTALHAAACDYCLSHAGAFALPPAPAAGLPNPPLQTTQAPQSLALAAPSTHRDWASPAPRAPPALLG